MELGLKLMSEIRSPAELVHHAELAERAGLGFVGISDHYLPWLTDQHHSPFAWSVLGAVAARTERIDLVTMVTCPIIRYHPVLLAQMAATTAVLAEGRLKLGLGSGEQLNEHIYGGAWPAPDLRHDMLMEAVEILRMLWTGDRIVHRGDFYDVDRARVYDLPEDPIDILFAISGEDSLDVAVEVADGVVGTEPVDGLLDAYAERGGDATKTFTELPCGWAATEDEGAELLRERFRFGTLGWPVMAEVPDERNFEDLTADVTAADMAEEMPCGPDPERYVEAMREFADAGFAHLAAIPAGDDAEGFVSFLTDEVLPRL